MRYRSVAFGTPPAGMDSDWVLARALPVIFACGMIYAIATASIGWGNTLNDRHSFRQSQTATTAYYMVGQPLKFAYETPVLGKPWPLPLEFPLYQWIVARIVGLLGTPLDQTGRFVSLVFFLLTPIPLYRLARSAGVSAAHAWVPATLFVISPFYIFWGRTFMIELAATFFGMCYLCATLEWRRADSWGPWAVAVTCGALAALVKITTFAVFLAPVGLVTAYAVLLAWQANSRDRPRLQQAVAWLAVPLIPFLIGVLWSRFAAQIRAENPIAAAYLTGPMASEWVYGTLDQKFSLQVWMAITDRCVELIGYPPFAWLLLGATLAITLVAPRRWKETTACFGCYLLAPAVFTNVHFIHDYYMSANGVFLIMAIGFAFVGLFEDARTRKAAGVLLALAIFTAVTGHRLMHLPRQTLDNSDILKAAEYIQSATAEDSIIICLSSDWSPVVSYYARRRSLNLPMVSGAAGTMSSELVATALERLKDEKIGAIVLVEPVLYPLEIVRQQLRNAGIDPPVLTIKGLSRL
jgi:hypothetical protein